MMSIEVPDSVPVKNSDSSNVLARARTGSLCRGLVEELCRDLPGDDVIIAEWLAEAQGKRNDHLFTNLLFAALAAGRTVDSRILIEGAALLPDTHCLAIAAAHCSGNVASALIEASKKRCLGWERDAVTLLMAGLWCSRHASEAFPPELVSRARMLARESRESIFAQLPLLALSNVTKSEALRSLIIDEGSDLIALAEELKTDYECLFSTSVIDEIPVAPQISEAWSKPIQRAVPRVGRNEPCPCGSGKKYKKCCFEKDRERLSHSSHIAGVTIEELHANPETYLSQDRIMEMRSYELARLDPTRVSMELHPALLSRLTLFGEYESIIDFFKTVGITPQLEGYWNDAVHFATMEGRKDTVITLLRLNGITETEQLERFPSMGLAQYLLMMDEKPCRILKKIEAYSRQSVAGDTANAEEELAYALFESGFPGLGILAARAAIPLSLDPLTTSVLLDKINQTRDELGFSPEEPFEHIVEELSGRWISDDNPDIDILIKSRDELNRKNAETRQLKREIEKLHDELNRRETMLAARQKDSPPITVSTPAPTPDKLVVELRTRIATLKSELNQRHSEKNMLRRELESTQSDLQKLKQQQMNKKVLEEETNEDEKENALLEDVPVSVQAIRIPIFSERFKRAIESHSIPTSASALRLIGRLAAGDASAFTGSKCLRANHSIMRQRIGIKHRLLFSLKGASLEIIDLIDRKDLEKTIRNFS